MGFGEKIKTLRIEKGMTLEEVGNIVGVGKSTVRKWESGEIANMRRDKIALLAKALGVTPGYLMGWEEPVNTIPDYPNVLPIRRKRVPLLGSIAAGIPIYADADHESYATCDDDVRCDFALRVEGDSMIGARILDGDIVFIREQPDVEDGEIAAIIIDDSVTLKRVYHIKNGLQLLSENTKYRPMIYTNSNSEYLRVLGKAVAFQSDVI